MATIVVIDDDDGLRDTIGLMLENEGYRPLLVADGATGERQGEDGDPRGAATGAGEVTGAHGQNLNSRPRLGMIGRPRT